MKLNRILLFFICIFLMTDIYGLNAEYVIQMKNGNEFEIDNYEKRGNDICFKIYGGEMCVDKKEVQEIINKEQNQKENKEEKKKEKNLETFSYPVETDEKQDMEEGVFIDAKYQEGIEYYRKDEYQKAIDYFLDKLNGRDDLNIRKLLANSYAGLALQFYHANLIDDAIKMFFEAKEYNPSEKEFSKLLGIIYYNRGNFDKAKEMFKAVVELDDSNTFSHEFLGRSYYYTNNTKEALVELKIAVDKEPNNLSLREFKEKVEKENNNEHLFQKTKQEIFLIQYDYNTEFHSSSLVMGSLSEAYWHIVQDLSFYNKKDFVIPVIIYTQKDFKEAVAHPEWAGAMYDGKIRIPAGDIDKQGDRTLENFIYHEVAHAILFYYCQGKTIPTWLNEGFAQMEEKYPKDIKKIKNVLEQSSLIPLKDLNTDFSCFNNRTMVDMAYAEAYAAVNFISEKYSRQAIINILNKLTEDSSIEEIIKSTLFIDSGQFEKRLKEYVLE